MSYFKFSLTYSVPTERLEDAAKVLSEIVLPSFERPQQLEHLHWQEYTTDAAGLEALVAAGFTPSLKGIPEQAGPWLQVLSRLRGIEEKLAQQPGPSMLFNERCSVTVPGLGLLLINDVTVMYDSCTDDLREMLDAGWRILAICPQPDQRRPDYILGRAWRKEQ